VFLPLAAMTTAFIAAAIVSWRRLGSLLIDGGRELEVPRRLVDGDVLYRDLRYYWGPLAPYVNASLYRVFGVHADVLAWAGMVTAALACAGLYLLARGFMTRWVSASVGIAFVFLCAFSERIRVAIFNFVLPFNYSATYGMTAAIWSVHLLVRYAETRRRGPLIASTVLAGLAALTKAEVVIALAAAHLAFLLGRGERPRTTEILAYAGGVATAASGFTVAAIASDGRIWVNLGMLANPASRHYVADTMGALSPGLWLGDALLSAIGLGIAALAATLAARRWGRPGGKASAGLAATIGFAIPAALLPDNSLRSMPVVMLVILSGLVVARIRRGRAWRGHTLDAHLAIWAFGLASVARIPLRVGPDHYGFFLIPPVLVCLALVFSVYLPEAAGGRPESHHVFRLCAVALLAGLAVSGLRASLPWYRSPCVDLVTARVHLCVDPRGPEMAVVPLLAHFPPQTRASAVPEGAGLVFAAGLRSGADGMTSYLPMEVPDDSADARLVAEWERSPPDLVVYTGIGRESGSRGFGADYCRRAHQWLSTNYRVVEQPAPQFLLLGR
jgi:hypothetical protein